jgi:hypothetical protein
LRLKFAGKNGNLNLDKILSSLSTPKTTEGGVSVEKKEEVLNFQKKISSPRVISKKDTNYLIQTILSKKELNTTFIAEILNKVSLEDKVAGLRRITNFQEILIENIEIKHKSLFPTCELEKYKEVKKLVKKALGENSCSNLLIMKKVYMINGNLI